MIQDPARRNAVLDRPLDLSPDRLAAIAMQAGITFLWAAHVHPGMRHAGAVRRALGVPTVFNLLGPLINPANPTHRVVGGVNCCGLSAQYDA
jgi:anthranilate phosphoribosyltransferase